MSESQKKTDNHKSWWLRIFGRSLFGLVFGNYLADKNVASTVIAIGIVATLCYLAVTDKELRVQLMPVLANLVFVIAGYYFASAREKPNDDEK